jgi:DNA segregation ATPase FtsK/SpoIIIE, S-DNA-T family
MRKYDHKVIARSRVVLSSVLFVFVAFLFSAIALFVTSDKLSALVCAVFSVAIPFVVWKIYDIRNIEFYLALGFTMSIYAKWAAACKSLGLVWTGQKNEVHTPWISDLSGNKQHWRAIVHSPGGKFTIEQLQAHSKSFAEIMGMAAVSFSWRPGGSIAVVGSMVLVPVIEVPAVDLAVLPEAKKVLSPVERLSSVNVGLNVEGQPFSMPVISNHILISGESGAGKASWVWAFVFGLAPSVQAGVVRLWGLDPKFIELAIGSAWWDEYACEFPDMVSLIARFEQDMRDRNRSLAGIARKFKPSREMPLNVLVIDELADLMTGVDKKQAEQINRMLTAILRLGRAAGYVVIGATQSPLKDAVPCRDDFITKIGLRMRSSLVDVLLGTGSKEAGALCWTIPKTGAGMAYVIGESGIPVLVRPQWHDDDDIRRFGQLVRMGINSVTEVNTEQLLVPGAWSMPVLEQEI